MTKESVIIEQLTIDRIGKKIFFQIMLPKDTQRIIGLEFGVMEKEGHLLNAPAIPANYLQVVPNKVIGRITLQVAGKEHLFCQHDIVEDRNIWMGEKGGIATGLPELWSHGRKKEELPVRVDENTVIEGYYQDRWGIYEFSTLTYKLNVYVWIEKCLL
jgi:hypothetical protein